jgi:hypothetical protein
MRTERIHDHKGVSTDLIGPTPNALKFVSDGERAWDEINWCGRCIKVILFRGCHISHPHIDIVFSDQKEDWILKRRKPAGFPAGVLFVFVL